MPSSQHEALVQVFRQRPAFGAATLALAYARAARAPFSRPVDRQSVGRKLSPLVRRCQDLFERLAGSDD